MVPWEERIEEAHKQVNISPSSLKAIRGDGEPGTSQWKLVVGASQGFTLESIGSPRGQRSSLQEIGHGHHKGGGDSIQVALA